MVGDGQAEVVIREATRRDAAGLAAHLADLVAEPVNNTALSPSDLIDQGGALEHAIAGFQNRPNSRILVADLAAGGGIVGVATCEGGTTRCGRHAGRLGLSVNRHHRRRGIGRRLMTELIAWAFCPTAGPLARLELHVYCRNLAAIGLYQQLGFRIEGRRRAAIWQDQQWLDEYLMARLRDDVAAMLGPPGPRPDD